MRVGICGYPGSGKTTVFQALAPGAKPSNKGVSLGSIKVPDGRVDRLAEIFSPRKTVFAEIVFADVGNTAGPGAGAFSPAVLEAMRNMDVLVNVVRAFDSPMGEGDPEPARDISMFDDELVLLDLALVERRADRWRREQRKGLEVQVNDRMLEHLGEGMPLRTLELNPAERLTLQSIQLFSLKPLIILHNLDEERWDDPDWRQARELREVGPNCWSMGLCAQLESELNELEPEERAEMLSELGLDEPAAAVFVRTAYSLLDLISFLTFGPDECRAWPIRRGTVARKAAGKVHSDIERGFIRAEVSKLEDLVEHRTEAALRAAGKTRLEGKEYEVQDGDLIVFRFNV
jgi:GTP-binding protein YchF